MPSNDMDRLSAPAPLTSAQIRSAAEAITDRPRIDDADRLSAREVHLLLTALRIVAAESDASAKAEADGYIAQRVVDSLRTAATTTTAEPTTGEATTTAANKYARDADANCAAGGGDDGDVCYRDLEACLLRIPVVDNVAGNTTATATDPDATNAEPRITFTSPEQAAAAADTDGDGEGDGSRSQSPPMSRVTPSADHLSPAGSPIVPKATPAATATPTKKQPTNKAPAFTLLSDAAENECALSADVEGLLARYAARMDVLEDDMSDRAVGLVDTWTSLVNRGIDTTLVNLIKAAEKDPSLPSHVLLQQLQHSEHDRFLLEASTNSTSTYDGMGASTNSAAAAAGGNNHHHGIRRTTPVAPFVSIMATQHLSRAPSSVWEVDAALLFIDISGYSAVASVLSQVNPFELSRVVNEYFGELLSVVRKAGGDVIKFAGDAVLVAWHNSDRTPARNLRAAIACALEIVEHHGDFAVPPAGSFGVHIGVASGTVRSRIFMPNQSSNATVMPAAFHFVSGAPLADASAACGIAKRGQIAIHHGASELMAAEEPAYPLTLVSVTATSPRGAAGGDFDEAAIAPVSVPFHFVEGMPDVDLDTHGHDDLDHHGESDDDDHHHHHETSPKKQRSPMLKRRSRRDFRVPIRPGRRAHFIRPPARPFSATTALPWLRKQGNLLTSCVQPANSADAAAVATGSVTGTIVDELLFIPPRVSEQLAIGSEPLLMAQMRDLIVLFVRMGGSQLDSTDVDSDPTVWFGEVHSTLRDHGCAIVQVIDDDKGVHIVAAFNLYTITGDAASRCVDAATALRRCKSDSYVGAAAGTVFCGVLGHKHACQWDITGAACVRACRLMQHAVAADVPIVLDPSVYSLTEDRSTLTDLPGGGLTLKGTAAPVNAYTVVPDPSTSLSSTPQSLVGIDTGGARRASVKPVDHNGTSLSPTSFHSRVKRAIGFTNNGGGGGGLTTVESLSSVPDHHDNDDDHHHARPLLSASPSAAQSGVATPRLRSAIRPNLLGGKKASMAAAATDAKPPRLHFSNTLSNYVLVKDVAHVRRVITSGTEGSKKHTVIIRGPPCTGKFSVILNALEGTGFVPLVHTSEESHHSQSGTIGLLESIATWFAASINRHVAAAAHHVLEHLAHARTSAAFNAGVDLMRTIVSRKIRVAVIVRRIQHLDEGSLALVRVLHDEFGHRSSLALLITCSPIPSRELVHTFLRLPPVGGEPATTTNIAATESECALMSARDGAAHIYIDKLAESEALAIVCHCLKGRVEKAIVDWIYTKSSGTLGWIVELCKFLAANAFMVPTTSGTLTMRASVKKDVDAMVWTDISPHLTVKVMQVVDLLPATLLMMCKIVAAITEQPGISAFYYSVNRVTQVVVGRDLEVDDIRYLQRLCLLRECEHKCTAHKGNANGELDAAIFFIPPMRDVVAGMLTPRQRTEINVICAKVYADTHPMDHPLQYLVRARHWLFATTNQEEYENDMAAGWRLAIDATKKFTTQERSDAKAKLLPWMAEMPKDVCMGFMSDKDLKRWQVSLRMDRRGSSDRRRSSNRQASFNASGGATPVGLRRRSSLVVAAKDDGGRASPLDLENSLCAAAIADADADDMERIASLRCTRNELHSMYTSEKSLCLGPCRDYLDSVIAAVQALNECLLDAETRFIQHEKEEALKSNNSDSDGLSTSSQSGLASSSTTNNLLASDFDAPTIPSSVVQRYRGAVNDYRIILHGQSQPIAPDPRSAEEDQASQRKLNNELTRLVGAVSEHVVAHLESAVFRPEAVHEMHFPPSEIALSVARDLVRDAVFSITEHYKKDLPELTELFSSHQRSALLHSVRTIGAEITSRTDDRNEGPQVYHLERVVRVATEDDVADGIAHAIDAFDAAGDDMSTDTSTLVVLYSHMPLVLDTYCRSSHRLRESFVEGLRAFFESMFAMATVRRRTREQFFIFLALWVNCCREATLFQ